MARSTNPFVRQARGLVVLVVAALTGGISGAMFAYAPDRPEISTLDDYAPSTITRVYAAGGEEIGQFATERRVIIGYDDIPEVLRQAIISSEDASFFSHFGFNLRRMAITVIQNVLRQRRRGASTLTQQLARQVSLDGAAPLGTEKFWSRKVDEAILTIQIEKRYTKREILTLYCNQMYLGSGAYGVEAASRLYFGKPALELTLGGSGADRRHLPAAHAPKSAPQPGSRSQPTQLRAGTDGRHRLHHTGRGGCGNGRRHRASGANTATANTGRVLLRRGGAAASRGHLRRRLVV